MKNGRFVAVGSTADVRNLATARTTVVDAQQMTVVPGSSTRIRIRAASRNCSASIPTFVRARDSIGDQAEGGTLGAGNLDQRVHVRRHEARSAAHTQGPRRGDDGTSVAVAHRGGHTTFYNSKAFELAGITRDTPDPPDGRFFRDNGELNGRVAENARDVFDKVGKQETFTPEQQRDRARQGMAHMSKLFNAAV
ncbi:MAG: hypothetical protein Udaeo2_31990 [Candidatus Udaeobacter sp.]|nr:MAG: hypothetical protein Udaeo2_31990 [Candidatus Udaeobacter sp.]